MCADNYRPLRVQVHHLLESCHCSPVMFAQKISAIAKKPGTRFPFGDLQERGNVMQFSTIAIEFHLIISYKKVLIPHEKNIETFFRFAQYAYGKEIEHTIHEKQ